MAGEAFPRVDVHAHVVIEAAQQLVAPHFSLDKEPALRFASEDSRRVTFEHFAEAQCKLTRTPDRLPDMDRMGIDVQVLSPSPNQYYYWAEPGLGSRAARAVNDGLASLVDSDRQRFAAMGTVPLQHAQAAIGELHRCIDELGFCGIEIGSHVDGRELADPTLEPFLQAAAERGVLLFLHPLGFTHGERMAPHHLNNVVGNPLESTLAVSHLILEGVLERHPDLCLCVAHGGGYLPLYTGRMDHAWRAREDCRRHTPRKPSEYVQRLFFDTVVYDPAHLAQLVERFGCEALLLGTDYPFDMGEADPVGLLEATPGLTADDRRAIAAGNAIRLLRLDDARTRGAERLRQPRD